MKCEECGEESINEICEECISDLEQRELERTLWDRR